MKLWNYLLLLKILINKGELIYVNVGSGKSSLIHSILNNMIPISKQEKPKININ